MRKLSVMVTVAALLSGTFPASALAASPVAPTLAAPPAARPVVRLARPAAEEADEIALDPRFVRAVTEAGYDIRLADGTFLHRESGRGIPWVLFRRAGLNLDEQGRLVYADSLVPVEHRHLSGMLRGLLEFADVARHSPAEAGRALQGWGVPPAYDGIHLVNPDGTATYFGLMLYHSLKDRPQARSNLSGERLARSLSLFQGAYAQAFGDSAPDVAFADLSRAAAMLAWNELRAGETPVVLAPYRELPTAFAAHRTRVEGALAEVRSQRRPDAARVRELEESLGAIDALGRHRYHGNMNLGNMPPPPAPPGPPPQHRLLPQLVRVLDRLNGRPLEDSELEALVKSFPMGESVWRMGGHHLWRAGYTGRGVRVAVIDTGVGQHPDLAGVVRARENFTHQRGGGMLGDHATHVAGTVHALAPDAQIRSYRAIDEGSFQENGRLMMSNEETDRALLAAINRAAADGNRVINMSLGGAANPSGPLARRIDELSRRGVVFVISAGNSGAGGVRNPSNAATALTVGAVDVNGRVASFSSHGEVFDPARISHEIKRVYLAPGQNIRSAVHNTDGVRAYARMSGTSMAAPHMSGSVALLWQAVRDANRSANPVELSRQIEDLLLRTARPVPRNELPSDVPPDQEFYRIDPVAAYRALRPVS